MATLVLLGAGASHGSEPYGSALTPPLGDNLFSRLEALGGVAARVPEDIKSIFREDFEAGMALFNKRCSQKLQSFHRELSHYLSGFTPSSASYYIKLIEQLKARNVIFSSLNYDMMFEESARYLGRRITYNLDRDGESIRLLKPHGSLNIWPAIPAANIRGLKLIGVQTAYEGRVQALDRLAARARCLEDDSLSPAISMYAKGKRASVSPRFVVQQQKMFALACRRASRIIVLGTKVVPEDEHIWSPIAESSAELFYFGNQADKANLLEWCGSSKRKNVSFADGYFVALLALLNKIV